MAAQWQQARDAPAAAARHRGAVRRATAVVAPTTAVLRETLHTSLRLGRRPNQLRCSGVAPGDRSCSREPSGGVHDETAPATP